MNLEFYLVGTLITLLTTLVILYVQYGNSVADYVYFLLGTWLFYYILGFSVFWILTIPFLLIGWVSKNVIEFYLLVENLYIAVGEDGDDLDNSEE